MARGVRVLQRPGVPQATAGKVTDDHGATRAIKAKARRGTTSRAAQRASRVTIWYRITPSDQRSTACVIVRASIVSGHLGRTPDGLATEV
jgi:hypothetical protein